MEQSLGEKEQAQGYQGHTAQSFRSLAEAFTDPSAEEQTESGGQKRLNGNRDDDRDQRQPGQAKTQTRWPTRPRCC